jgi:uncharacterized protein (UPF0264 family)
MASLLISVINAQEAQVAIESGADIIDLKDPTNGALGALTNDTIESVVRAVAGERKTSATIGDIPMVPALIEARVRALMQMNLDYIKIGFFSADDYTDCINSLAGLIMQGVKVIAVLFAEYQYPLNLIPQLQKKGFVGVMLDTAEKNGLTLFDHYSESEINKFSQLVSQAGMMLGLAGSLNIKHIDQLKAFNPDYLGFRGGVCDDNDRKQHLQYEKIKAISKLM